MTIAASPELTTVTASGATMIGAIVLAAGRSQRMGTQKLLLPYRGQTIVGHVVDQVFGAGLKNVNVIVGVDGQDVAAALAGKPVTLVANPDPSAEMLSSVRCGLRALAKSCEAALIALGDQPGVTGDMIGQIAKAYQTSNEGIVVPAYQGTRGHPIVIARRYFHEVLNQYDGIGLRALLLAHADEVCEAAMLDAAVLADIDNAEDYRRASSQ